MAKPSLKPIFRGGYRLFSEPLLVHQADLSWLDCPEKMRVDDIKKHKVVIYDLSSEAFLFEDKDDFLSEKLLGFHRVLAERNIDAKKVVLLNANENSHSGYHNWCQSKNLSQRIQVIGYPFYLGTFWADVKAYFKAHNIESSLINKVIGTRDHLRERVYRCLNHRPRSHRYGIVGHLKYLNLLSKGFVSFGGEKEGRIDAPTVSSFDETMDFFERLGWSQQQKLSVVELSQGKALKYDSSVESIQTGLWGKPTGGVFQPLCLNQNKPLDSTSITDSYFEFVSETWFTDSQCRYLTEKTLRPMIHLRPFLHFGTPGVLRQLRDWGFKTFSNAIDESYDDIEDPIQRMQALLIEMTRLAQLELKEAHELYWELWPALEHNYYHFLESGGDLFHNEVKSRVLEPLAQQVVRYH